MKRILVVILALMLSLFSACDPKVFSEFVSIAFEEEDPNAPPKVYKSTAPQIMFESIMEALENKDSKALKSLFAPNAVEEVADLDQQIERLMKFYKGTMLSHSSFDSGSGESETADGGYVYMRINPAIRKLVTDEAVYSMGFNSVPVHEEAPDDVGLWRIILQLKNGDGIEDVADQRIAGTPYMD